MEAQDKWVIVFHVERFHIAARSRCWEMLENANIFSRFLNQIQNDKDECLVKTLVNLFRFDWYR